MTFSALLDRTTRLYRVNFRPLITVTAVLSVVNLPLALLLAPASRPGGAPIVGWPVYIAIAALEMMLISPLLFGATGHSALDIVAGRPTSARVSFRTAFARYGTLIGAWLLVALMAVPVGLAWFGLSRINLVLAGLALMILTVPAIFVLLGLSLTPIVIMDRTITAAGALKRSWWLMQGLRPRVFGLLFVWMVLQTVATYAVGGALRLVIPPDVANALAQQIAAILLSPCWALSLALVFQQAKIDREATDLILEAQRLARASAAAVSPVPSVR